MASTVTAATAALYARLVAAAGLAGVDVVFGPPDAYEAQEVVSLLGVFDPQEQHAALGINVRDERYDIEVAVKVHGPVSTAQETFNRSRVLVDAVVNSVNDTTTGRTLNGTVTDAEVRSTTTSGAFKINAADGGGWVIYWTVMVACHAFKENF